MSDLTEHPQVREAFRRFTVGGSYDGMSLGDSVLRAKNELVSAIVSAYRSALAGEDFDTSLKAFADKVCESFVALGPRFTGGNLAPSVTLLADVVAVAKEHAWRLRAPLLVQLQDKEERIKALEGELSHHLHCRTCAEDGCSSCPNCNAEKFLPEEAP